MVVQHVVLAVKRVGERELITRDARNVIRHKFQRVAPERRIFGDGEHNLDVDRCCRCSRDGDGPVRQPHVVGRVTVAIDKPDIGEQRLDLRRCEQRPAVVVDGQHVQRVGDVPATFGVDEPGRFAAGRRVALFVVGREPEQFDCELVGNVDGVEVVHVTVVDEFVVWQEPVVDQFERDRINQMRVRTQPQRHTIQHHNRAVTSHRVHAIQRRFKQPDRVFVKDPRRRISPIEHVPIGIGQHQRDLRIKPVTAVSALKRQRHIIERLTRHQRHIRNINTLNGEPKLARNRRTKHQIVHNLVVATNRDLFRTGPETGQISRNLVHTLRHIIKPVDAVATNRHRQHIATINRRQHHNRTISRNSKISVDAVQAHRS